MSPSNLRGNRPRRWRPGLQPLGSVAFVLFCQATVAGVPSTPLPPGPTTVKVTPSHVVISNAVLCATWPIRESGLAAASFVDVQGGSRLQLHGALFEVVLADGTRYSNLPPHGDIRVRHLAPITASPRPADRTPGRVVEMPTRSADGRLSVTWRAIALDGAHYLRQEIDLTPEREDCLIRNLVWLHDRIPGARTMGEVDGSPVAALPFFLGIEDPHAHNRAGSPAARADALLSAGAATAGARPPPGTNDWVICQLDRNAVLRRGETLRVSFVTGVAPANQLRRAFLAYLERERAHPYRPYLHYNSWYDTAWDPFALNETNCLEAIRLIGERLIQPHGVVMDGMVFDDGWDNPQSLWQFHAGFPRGFSPLAELCQRYRTHLGVWLSPFGGYGEPRQQRLRFGHAQGYETNAAGFSLAGPQYYSAFKQACVRMIRDFGVNHFKFDGIATGMRARGGGQYVLDTEAMRRLMLELRQESPGLFINLTTGSWPSPFWLRYADSLWRQGHDMGHAGPGSRQQQWLTYRDQETYRNIVCKAPLYPLNALMSQGVAYSRRGMAGDPTFDARGFRDDVRAFFGSGTALQELYIQPGRLTPEDWRLLAEAAHWSRSRADVLVDTHWIGGDPGKSEVYGYASWAPHRGILMLRNPAAEPQRIALDLGQAFELPAGAATRFRLQSPWTDHAASPILEVTAGHAHTFGLEPFEVVVYDATPAAHQPGRPYEAQGNP